MQRLLVSFAYKAFVDVRAVGAVVVKAKVS
jgi:hypothetical protein